MPRAPRTSGPDRGPGPAPGCRPALRSRRQRRRDVGVADHLGVRSPDRGGIDLRQTCPASLISCSRPWRSTTSTPPPFPRAWPPCARGRGTRILKPPSELLSRPIEDPGHHARLRRHRPWYSVAAASNRPRCSGRLGHGRNRAHPAAAGSATRGATPAQSPPAAARPKATSVARPTSGDLLGDRRERQRQADERHPRVARGGRRGFQKIAFDRGWPGVATVARVPTSAECGPAARTSGRLQVIVQARLACRRRGLRVGRDFSPSAAMRVRGGGQGAAEAMMSSSIGRDRRWRFGRWRGEIGDEQGLVRQVPLDRLGARGGRISHAMMTVASVERSCGDAEGREKDLGAEGDSHACNVRSARAWPAGAPSATPAIVGSLSHRRSGPPDYVHAGLRSGCRRRRTRHLGFD